MRAIGMGRVMMRVRGVERQLRQERLTPERAQVCHTPCVTVMSLR
jgi:hypothetical protein